MNRSLTVGLVVVVLSSTAAPAEPLELGDYLSSINHTEVQFSGRIGFDRQGFTFWSDEQEFFAANIDAGREVRETIQTECLTTGLFVDISELCKISGVGSIEVKGSQILLSIEQVNSLEKE